MIWRVRKLGAKYRAKLQWHTWFAWFPVRVPTKGRMSQQHRVWLQTIKRRGYISRYYTDFGPRSYMNWEYSLIGSEYPRKSKELKTPKCKPPKEI